jgi:hypothetical protein
MSISTYAELQTAVASWLDRSDLSANIPDFIALAEARIARRLRVRGVEERSTTPLVSGQQYYALPSDFLQARNVQINTNPLNVLTYRTPEELDKEYPSTAGGTPRAFTIIGEEIQLKPIPGSTDTMEIAYFKRLPALSNSNTTNWLTANAPDLLLYGSLIESEAFLVNDPRIQIWNTLFDEAMKEWTHQDEKGRYSGSHIEIRARQ